MRRLAWTAALVPLLASVPRGAGADTVERAIVVDGVSRTYLVHVPASWDGARPLPVLFVFHGAGSDSENMVAATGFDALAAKEPMLVVYPRAPQPEVRYDVDPPAGRPSADVRLFDSLLERLRSRFPVDRRRVWATGFSNGAAFCYRLAAERPGVVAAIAPVAGYLPRLSREGEVVPVPLLHVHGTADDRVAAPGRPGVAGSAVAAWARWNGAARGPTETRPAMGSLTVRRLAYTGATPRSDAGLLLVEGAGHEWPGGPAGPVSRAVLDFFAAHPLPEAAPAERAENPLVGQPFGSTASLRWLTPEGGPVSLAAQRLTLFRWWTNECPHCTGSVPALARLEARWRARGLRMVGVYHPKGAPLADAAARDYARRLGFSGALAFDDRWTKYEELRDRGGLDRATSVSLLVDAGGIVRWVHPGPRIEEGSADLAALEAAIERLLPATPPSGLTTE